MQQQGIKPSALIKKDGVIITPSFFVLIGFPFTGNSITYPQYIFNIGAITNETIDISLINILMEGPEVSLKGSPTVSPTTAAL